MQIGREIGEEEVFELRLEGVQRRNNPYVSWKSIPAAWGRVGKSFFPNSRRVKQRGVEQHIQWTGYADFNGQG